MKGILSKSRMVTSFFRVTKNGVLIVYDIMKIFWMIVLIKSVSVMSLVKTYIFIFILYI
jgi:hypothetical protein